ncbi:MAG: transcription termination/antitermination NusG family protein [Alphaproteobacteria bacterium]
MKRWYAAYTHAREEILALENLRRQGFAAYLPRYLKRRRHARRTDWVAAPLFPRYMFVELDIETRPWRAVRSTVGIASLVTQGDRPAPVPESAIAAIRAREDVRGLVALNDGWIAGGAKVRIEEGPFADFEGVFDCATDDERVIVLLDLLGRQVRARVPFGAVTALA